MNSRYDLTGGEDGEVKLWELPSGKLIKSLGRHEGTVIYDDCGECGEGERPHQQFPVSALRFGGGGQYVASCASGGTTEYQVGQVKLWEVPSGRLLKNISLDTEVLDIALDPGGQYLAASTAAYTVEV